MANHVHLVAVPTGAEGLRLGIAEAHRRYSRRVNVREGWRGHLWQGRFASFVMDEPYLLAAVRYVQRNPVRAGLCRQAWDWPWSRAAAHVGGQDDGLVRVGPMRRRVKDWRRDLQGTDDDELARSLRRHEATGRPLGDETFLERLEGVLGRALRPKKRGPKPRRTSRQVRCP